jgi:integrase
VNARDWLRIALLTGLRDAVVGELRWDKVNMEDRLLLVPPEVRGNKAKKLVWIPLSDWLYENVFKPRYDARKPDIPWVIPSHKKAGRPLTEFRGTALTMKEETGIHVNPHKLRRTFATLARTATNSDIMVSRMLTHSSRSSGRSEAAVVTAGYVQPEHDELREAFNSTARVIVEYATKPPKENA